MKVISKAYHDVEISTQEYVKYYFEHHQYIPTWIMIKVVKFSNFINLVDCSKPEVKQAICALYGLIDDEGKADFALLIGSLNWLRMVRNSCAHNERIYTMCHKKGRIKTAYMDALAPSYASGRDKRIIDLLVYLKYYCPHKEYCELIDQIKQALRRLDGQIKSVAFNNVRSELGIKELSHLDKLCEHPKRIKYNSLSKL